MAIADEVSTRPAVEDEAGLLAPSIVLTAAASARVQRLLEERQLTGHALRVFVSGGGCSGLQYGMALEGQPRETDLRFGFNGIDVVVDPLSMDYLSGATIDYIEDLMGGGFKIENPNAVSSCGCGHSFRTSRDGAASAGECGCH
ncbi:MAG TPA: iron-sulfur cluster insertion protein ErpA [Anaerolineales bacterium]|nr:iron-sulfur cluster insertion protein ErpA [Anaerolineales bacterium]